MENNSFVRGRDSLLQTLAMLKDEEDFQREFGGFEEEMDKRREKTVEGLCAMIARLKSKAEIKKQCVDSLEDVNKCWKVIREERGKLQEKVAELEKDKKVLEVRIRSLEDEVKDLKTSLQQQEEVSKCGDNDNSLYHTALRGGSDDDEDNEDEEDRGGSEESRNDDGPEDMDLESQNNNFQQKQIPFYKSRFDEFKIGGGSHSIKSGGEMASSSSTQKPNFNFPLLTGNPYETLDREHYNPTKFFQRQSSTFKRNTSKNGRGGRGGRGGKRKSGNNKNDSSAGDVGNKKTKRGNSVKGNDSSENDHNKTATSTTSGISSINVSNLKEKSQSASSEGIENEETSQSKEFPEDDSFDYTATVVEDASDYLNLSPHN